MGGSSRITCVAGFPGGNKPHVERSQSRDDGSDAPGVRAAGQTALLGLLTDAPESKRRIRLPRTGEPGAARLAQPGSPRPLLASCQSVEARLEAAHHRRPSKRLKSVSATTKRDAEQGGRWSRSDTLSHIRRHCADARDSDSDGDRS